MKKNKILTLTALSLIVTGSLVGCGSNDKDNNNDINTNVQIEQEQQDGKNDIADLPSSEIDNTDDNVKESKTFTYYVPNDNVDGLNKITLRGNIKENIEDPQYIIDTLISSGFVAENTKVNKFEKNDNGIYTLDLSKEFYDLKFGTSAETLLLDSIGNTFIEQFKLDKLKLTVDGENYSSGHILMEDTDYLTFEELNENSIESVMNID